VSGAVATEALTKRYGSKTALATLDLDLMSGRVVGLLGPNGAGKTTLLRLLTGALRPSSGTAQVLGLDCWRDSARLHRRTSYLPGDLRLTPELTGAQVLGLFAGLRGVPGKPYRDLADRLSADLDVPVRTLSKGNRQKIGLVQAFTGEPEVVLLDEPTSGLDPLAQEVVDTLVREAADRGALVVLSSHVLSEVQQVADDVIMLRAGRLVAIERLQSLREAAPHRVQVRTKGTWQPPTSVQDLEVADGLASFTAPARALDEIVKSLAREVVVELAVEPADLESLFLSYYAEADHEG
jgi:ABC-2 type transport system ATP-binding protein